VHKFGGAALGDASSIASVVELLRAAPLGTVAVVSAVEGATNALEELAGAAATGGGAWRPLAERYRLRHRSLLSQLGLDAELLDRWLAELATVTEGVARVGRVEPSVRDHLLSFGERMSARIVAACLRARGAACSALDAFDLGLRTDSNYGRARPLEESSVAVRERLGRLVEAGQRPVVTGFISADSSGRLTTLGRNGSDLSAALIAQALGARECVFWKWVDGVQTADPRLVAGARTLPEIGYDQAEILGGLGAKVLHPEAVGPLRRAGIAARIASLRHPERPGTRVTASARAPCVRCVVSRAPVVWFEAAPERAGQLARGVRSAAPDVAFEIAGARPGWVCSPRGSGGADLARELADVARSAAGVACLAAFGWNGMAEEFAEVLQRAGVELLAVGLAGGVPVAVVAEARLESAVRAVHAALESEAGERADRRDYFDAAAH
jgi:aspartate kinase